jgi:hypothetical protein
MIKTGKNTLMRNNLTSGNTVSKTIRDVLLQTDKKYKGNYQYCDSPIIMTKTVHF